MKTIYKLRAWQIFIQVLAILAIFILHVKGELHLLWVALLFYFIYGLLGSNLGYHRLESHNSFKTYAPIRYFLIFCGMCNSNCSPLSGVIIHRTHHRYADKKRDPHSPITMGIFKAYFNEWFIDDLRLNHALAKKELKSKFYIFTHRWYVEILFSYFMILSFIDWYVLVLCYVIPVAFTYHVKGLFNVLPHKWGYRNFDVNDNSKNNWFIHILTLGDGLHNNHHAHPERWNTKVRWWEIDPTAWLISIIRKR